MNNTCVLHTTHMNLKTDKENHVFKRSDHLQITSNTCIT